MATFADVERAEFQLSRGRLPDDYRSWCLDHDGVEGWFGEMYVSLFPLAGVVDVTEILGDTDRFPGFIAIGSDGGGETIALDLRQKVPPVVLVNNVSAGWHEGLFQAASFEEFMAQRQAGEPFRWDLAYDPAP